MVGLFALPKGMIEFRPEAPEDRAVIHAINQAAFDGAFEAELVDQLREDGLFLLSLVATIDGAVIGHVLFSRLDVTLDGRAVAAAALAPVAVLPEFQRRGIGSRLIEEGLAALPARGINAVFVLGHEDYYPRFGFSPELARRFASPFPVDAFMALELVPRALDGKSGQVTYPPAFGI